MKYHVDHPGGSRIILKYAGKDATCAYTQVFGPTVTLMLFAVRNTTPFTHQMLLRHICPQRSSEYNPTIPVDVQ